MKKNVKTDIIIIKDYYDTPVKMEPTFITVKTNGTSVKVRTFI